MKKSVYTMDEWWPLHTRAPHPTGGYDEIRPDVRTGSRRYFREGKLHRLDGPAVVKRSGGVLRGEIYFRDGMRHREDGPAARAFDADGTIRSLSYYRGGFLHRLDGPATIERVVNTGEIHERYYLSTVPLNELTDRDFRVELSAIPADEVRAEFARTPLAPLVTEDVDTHRIVFAVTAGLRTVEGIRAHLEGAPLEWARAFESSRDPFDVPGPESYPESVRMVEPLAETFVRP